MKRRHGDVTTAGMLTVEEVADYLHVHPSTIYRLVRRNQLPAFKIGNDWRFSVELIDRWRVEREIKTRNRN